MKSLFTIPTLVLLVFMLSCSSTYFYTSVNTTTPNLEKVENGDFLYETDSLWIAYCFKGEDAPIQITVGNKLDIPLYVDWNRSSLILDGRSYSYNTNKATHTTTTEYSFYGNTSWSTGNTELPTHISFIPPKTTISHSSLRLAAKFDEIDKKAYTNIKLGLANNTVAKAKRIKYDFEDSPLHFSSYITLYTDPNKPQAYQSDFHVVSLLKTQAKPENLPGDMADRGDIFYQQKVPNNTGWYILADVAIVSSAVALDVILYGDEY